MTLVALPEAVSTTAPAQRRDQQRQIQRAARDYGDLIGRLQAEEAAGVVHSPLVVLLRSIWEKAAQLLGLQTEEEFNAWLEATLPEAAGANHGVGADRKGAGEGKRVSVRVDHGGRRVIRKKERKSRTKTRH